MAKTRPLTPDEMKLRGDAAALIRTHLWMSKTPPPSPDSNRWHMGRELNVWTRLVHLGVDPEELNGAIKFARSVIHQPEEPLRLTIFYWNGATPKYEQARAAWIKSLDDVPYGRKAKVPPTVRDVMRRMAE